MPPDNRDRANCFFGACSRLINSVPTLHTDNSWKNHADKTGYRGPGRGRPIQIQPRVSTPGLPYAPPLSVPEWDVYHCLPILGTSTILGLGRRFGPGVETPGCIRQPVPGKKSTRLHHRPDR